MPLRKMGVELVIDYPKDELGSQGQYEDLILVDGNWYVNWMPESLITGGKDLLAHHDAVEAAENAVYIATKGRKKPTAKQLREAREATAFLATAVAVKQPILERIESRTPYRMVPKGRPDSDGWQRFSYPDPEEMLATPPAPRLRSSISIPAMMNRSDKSVEPLKHVQKYQWRAAQWRQHYGMRSLVESSNNHLKDPEKEGLGNKHKRRGRGFAYHYLASAFIAASSNMRRILTYVEEEARKVAAAGGAKLPRRRRRKDQHGKPLPRQTVAITGVSPSPPGL